MKALTAAYAGRYTFEYAQKKAAEILRRQPSSTDFVAKGVLACADMIDSTAAMLVDGRIEHDNSFRIAAYVAIPNARAALEGGDVSAAFAILQTGPQNSASSPSATD